MTTNVEIPHYAIHLFADQPEPIYGEDGYEQNYCGSWGYKTTEDDPEATTRDEDGDPIVCIWYDAESAFAALERCLSDPITRFVYPRLALHKGDSSEFID